MLKFINNLSIRNKLFVLVLFPLLGFMALASYNFAINYQAKVVLDKMQILNEAAYDSALLVHELQKERGASAGYLSSKGEKFQNTLQQQRQTTNQQQQLLEHFIETQELTPHLIELFSGIKQQLKKMPEIRARVDNFAISVQEEVAFYTHLNKLLLSIIDNTANENTNVELAISAVAIGSFLQHKERAGIERAILSSVFALDKFTPTSLERFIRLLAEQEIYLDKFKAHATQEQYAIYKNSLQGEAVNGVASFRKIALTKMKEGRFGVDPVIWFETITKKINILKAIEEDLFNELINTNDGLILLKNKFLASLAVVTLVPLLLVLILSIYIAKQLTSRIGEITKKIVSITKTDDLTVRINIDSKEELGEISQAINHLVSHLQRLVGNIQNTSEHLKLGLAENVENNQQISKKIIDGSDQVTLVVTATTEMSSTVSDIARNAMQASSEAEKASHESQHSNKQVEDTVENINKLSSELNKASGVIESLNDATLNISQFINMIKEISEKTNLLALNAAIEAARAGESGRGFAVVADEVRALAMQTQKSTNEIETMVSELQNRSCDAQKTMSIGISMVDDSVADAHKAGESISHIANSVDEINQMNEQVATAAEEQSSVTEEINRNMVNIQEGYADMQINYENIEKGNSEIEALAKELNSAVSKFKI